MRKDKTETISAQEKWPLSHPSTSHIVPMLVEWHACCSFLHPCPAEMKLFAMQPHDGLTSLLCSFSASPPAEKEMLNAISKSTPHRGRIRIAIEPWLPRTGLEAQSLFLLGPISNAAVKNLIFSCQVFWQRLHGLHTAAITRPGIPCEAHFDKPSGLVPARFSPCRNSTYSSKHPSRRPSHAKSGSRRVDPLPHR